MPSDNASRKPDSEAPFSPSRSYPTFAHAAISSMLTYSARTGTLGSGPPEPPHTTNPIPLLIRSIPVRMLISQTIWSIAITFVAYFVGDKSYSTLSVPYWTSHFLLPSTVVYGVGWALFVLLGFFIREASRRHREALVHWYELTSQIETLVRHLIQLYPAGTWHPGDTDRIVAHLMTYPVALKMMLRRERESLQIDSWLHSHDARDIIQSDDMHIHCMRVVRAYFTCSETDAHAGFQPATQSSPSGKAGSFFAVRLIDSIDLSANCMMRIAEFHPAIGYVNHLRIFLYIWLFFLPLALIQTSGWFTALWAVLITYGVGMLFIVAMALNDPFGYDIQDMKLNTLASQAALNVMDAYCLHERRLFDLIRADHNTPQWLETERQPKELNTTKKPSFLRRLIRFMLSAVCDRLQRILFVAMGIFLAWLSTVVFVTRYIAQNQSSPPDRVCRWWCVYMPASSSTTSYVGLGVFLLMGFWINDVYDRYWAGLQLWQISLKSCLNRLLFQTGFLCKTGTWHNRDIERLFSHIAALPYACKQHLRHCRDVTDFEGILAPEDIDALSEDPNYVAYCFRVIYAYINSLDKQDEDTLLSKKRPVNVSIFSMIITCWETEKILNECHALRNIPISPSFTLHLHVFAVFWLALLPLVFVQHDGFLAFLFLPPVAYSIIKLLIMGDELADPFGYDANDIPLDDLCEELRDLVYDVYNETRSGPASIVRKSSYSDEFNHTTASTTPRIALSEEFRPTFRGLLTNAMRYFPSVPWLAQISVTLWSVATVLISYRLSFVWGEERRNSSCQEWCSPIDVDKNVLLETGFALFLILSFRASDAMTRYQNGASLLHDLRMELRSLLIEMTQAYDRGVWHKNDKERIVAHLVQIPLLLRDKLLEVDLSHQEGILSIEDYLVCRSSTNPLRYCVQVVEAYMLSLDTPSEEWSFAPAQKRQKPAAALLFSMMRRINRIGDLISTMEGIKRFPTVSSYTKHQRLFTILWLLLLPLGMTPRTGFYTILWAPLISYGVLALEALATTLVDPFGHDRQDLPVNKICKEMASHLLEAVRSSEWDCTYHIIPSPVDNAARLGTFLAGKQIRNNYDLPRLAKEEHGDFADTPSLVFSGPRETVTKPTLLSHLVRSVPWWVLISIAGWTSLVVVLSRVTKIVDADSRLWRSAVSIDGVVATYIGFPAFMLLGFYVQASFARYMEAGNVWGDDLRATCHSLAAQWYLLAAPGTWHKGDHERVLSHLAAIPIALKMELRDKRDIRELKGLLSQQDLGRVLTAESMSSHCLDVIKAYYIAAQCRPEALSDPSELITDYRKSIKYELRNIEIALCRCKFLKAYPIAPSFMVLLRTILGIWFICLPFVLAETTGWFSILWVPIIAYGFIGMYAIAHELQQPFGSDLNDFDLDKLAHTIVEAVLFVEQNLRGGLDRLIVKIEHSGAAWEEEAAEKYDLSCLSDTERCDPSSLKWRTLQMALHAVPLWMIVTIGLWAAGSVTLAWLINRRWPVENSCAPAFCIPLAIDSFVKEYVGFALFLLLGFRLYDSHWRYVVALTVWRDGILTVTRLFANRMFEAYPTGSFHKGDSERIAAHLAAFSIVTTLQLRREGSCSAMLQGIMNEADIARLEKVEQKGDYCIDVVRAYLKADEKKMEWNGPSPSGAFVHWLLLCYLGLMKGYAATCERMLSVPMPFGYVQHIRIFLVIYMVTLPLGLVETSGWWTIAWVVIIAYGVIGVERWAAELTDPFGTDLSDLPLGKFRIDVVKALQTNLHWFRHGNESVIHPERKAFVVESGVH